MPRTVIDPKNKTQDSSQFPKLRLEKGEVARIYMIEQDPYFEFVHNLRAPKITNGVAETEEVTDQRSGETRTQIKMAFIGRPICLGDPGVLQEKGVDPANCPICAESIKNDRVDKPQRRYAVHILKYGTKAGTPNVMEPFVVQLQVWSFTDKVFNKLIDLGEAWAESGGLKGHDLQLGPCNNPTFQQFDIAALPSVAWNASDATKQLAKTTFTEQKLDDEKLRQFCGRDAKRDYVVQDLNTVLDRWATADGGDQGPPPDFFTPSSQADAQAAQAELSAGVAGLLEETSASAPAEGTTEPAPEVATEAPAEPAAPKEEVSFDDLLS